MIRLAIIDKLPKRQCTEELDIFYVGTVSVYPESWLEPADFVDGLGVLRVHTTAMVLKPFKPGPTEVMS